MQTFPSLQLAKVFLTFHANADPDLKQHYDLTAQFLWAAVTADTAAQGNPQLSHLAVPFPVVPEDNDILQWAMANFAVYNLLLGGGNHPMQQAILVPQQPPPNQQHQAASVVTPLLPAPLGGGGRPVPQLPPMLQPPPFNPPQIQPPPIHWLPLQPQLLLLQQGQQPPGLSPAQQHHPIIDMTLPDTNMGPPHTALPPSNKQMVQLFTKSIVHLMDRLPPPRHHHPALQTNLDDAFPEQAVSISSIDKTNIQSWSGLSADDFLPPFWMAFTKAKTNSLKTFVPNSFLTCAQHHNVRVQFTICTEFILDLKLCNFSHP